MPIAVTEEQRQLADAVAGWAQRAALTGVARARRDDPDAWRQTWPAVCDLGLLDAAAAHGASVTDQAVLLEAAPLAPGPVLASAVAALTLNSAGRAELLPADGAVALALDGDGLDVTSTGAGVELSGRVRPCYGAEAGLPVLVGAPHGCYLVPPDAERAKILDLDPVDLGTALGEATFTSARAEAVVDLTAEHLRELAVTLGAAQSAGLARWCLDTARSYARVREQFGRPIGSFQSIKHLCAQMLCRAEAAAAVAWDAAQAYGTDQHPVAAAVAGAVALDAAVDNAKDCIQVLGGIGFTWEHDAHLYLRRALALRQLLGGGAAWRRRLAELTVDGRRRTLRIELGEVEAQRAQVRATAERIAALPPAEQRAGLADSGYLVPHWPAPYGLEAEPALQLLVDEELARAGLTRPDLVIAGWAIPTILQHGTAEQVARFVRPTLLGDVVWCQLFSEPDAGSDLASLRTRAERVDGGWRLTGQKVWTSLAQHADWGICLARTDPVAPKHRGITYFLVDMGSPGIEVRPLREITGAERFNEVFLDGVFVPDELVVGEVGDGWRLARTTLAHERVAIGAGSAIGEDTERLVTQVARTGLADSALAERLGGLIADGLVGSLLDLRSTLRQLGGAAAGSESSVRKLLGVAHRQHLADLALDLAGPDAAVAGDEANGVLLARALSIAGGTTQVLLSVVAERLLGLPRD